MYVFTYLWIRSVSSPRVCSAADAPSPSAGKDASAGQFGERYPRGQTQKDICPNRTEPNRTDEFPKKSGTETNRTKPVPFLEQARAKPGRVRQDPQLLRWWRGDLVLAQKLRLGMGKKQVFKV